ncbi:hypothetical protein BAE44_0023182 [Dichanthelium oligosanthes]|uniref:Uncharacterized protein n=1 Tax=Dichanthelium oligosanthes TaxID=888268 RepID=A0A1E5USG9_9POAL|nr:hypothetical protein BAE44_0023182 [Dichanthelium oligosanthes]
MSATKFPTCSRATTMSDIQAHHLQITPDSSNGFS